MSILVSDDDGLCWQAQQEVLRALAYLELAKISFHTARLLQTAARAQ